MPDNGSGTHEVARGVPVVEVEGPCERVSLALAEAVACLDYLARVSTGDPERAVTDAQLAMYRIGAAVEELRASCLRAADQEKAARPLASK